jgi:hypothetical protein
LIPAMPNVIRPVQNEGKFRDEKGNPVMISTHSIPEFFSESFLFLINFFLTWKTCGVPWAEGWTNWPCWAVDTIMTLKEVDK